MEKAGPDAYRFVRDDVLPDREAHPRSGAERSRGGSRGDTISPKDPRADTA